MQAPLDLEIRQQLARYLAKRITLDDFEDWFVAESWNVHRDENTAATDLVFELELRLAEFSNGHWTEDDLRGILQLLVEPVGDSLRG